MENLNQNEIFTKYLQNIKKKKETEGKESRFKNHKS